MSIPTSTKGPVSWSDSCILVSVPWAFERHNGHVRNKRGRNGTRSDDGCGGSGEDGPVVMGSGAANNGSRCCHYNSVPAAYFTVQALRPLVSCRARIAASDGGAFVSSSLHLALVLGNLAATALLSTCTREPFVPVSIVEVALRSYVPTVHFVHVIYSAS